MVGKERAGTFCTVEQKLSNNNYKNVSKKVTPTVTDDSDIIECSLVENEKCDLLSTPKISTKNVASRSKHKHALVGDEKVNTSKTQNFKNEKNLQDCLRSSLKKTYGLTDDVKLLDTSKTNSPLRTPCTDRNDISSNSILKKIISSVKHTPDDVYLSKSKLRNIKQWLHDNDVEKVRTPPFANLSVTPVNSKKKKTVKKWLEKNKDDRNSSIDSEVEDVLKAVYGDDWLQKNIQSKCKTEPKKKSNKFPTTATVDPKMKRVNSVKSARRNILSAKKAKVLFDDSDSENVNFDNSVLSGINTINLDHSDCSEELVIAKDFTKIRKRKKTESDEHSIDSQSPLRRKKMKLKEKIPSSQLGRVNKTPTVSKEKPQGKATLKTPKKTFLASLSVSTPNSRCHPDAQEYKVNFKQKKEELVKKLYRLYNSEVFNGKLADDMNFSWNVKLRGTAGYCYNKRVTKSSGDIIRLSRIEFSTKIVDRADRLRDTMIHELCHAASWVIDGALDGHGPIWHGWASKAMARFPELPIIKRCHNYEIASKYVYRCTGCGYSIKRHSKSINTERKRCGHCFGVLELLLNKKRKGKNEIPEYDTTRTLPTPNKFALFVKENYHCVKSTKANAKHAEIMKILSQQYAIIKNGSKSDENLRE